MGSPGSRRRTSVSVGTSGTVEAMILTAALAALTMGRPTAALVLMAAAAVVSLTSGATANQPRLPPVANSTGATSRRSGKIEWVGWSAASVLADIRAASISCGCGLGWPSSSGGYGFTDRVDSAFIPRSRPIGSRAGDHLARVPVYGPWGQSGVDHAGVGPARPRARRAAGRRQQHGLGGGNAAPPGEHPTDRVHQPGVGGVATLHAGPVRHMGRHPADGMEGPEARSELSVRPAPGLSTYGSTVGGRHHHWQGARQAEPARSDSAGVRRTSGAWLPNSHHEARPSAEAQRGRAPKRRSPDDFAPGTPARTRTSRHFPDRRTHNSRSFSGSAVTCFGRTARRCFISSGRVARSPS